jgi:hypothetical protein
MAQAKTKAVKGGVVATVKRAQVPMIPGAEERFKKELEETRRKLAAPSGDQIKVTQAKKFIFPDGRELPGPFDAIVVDFVSANMYYETAYNPNAIVPPKCFAIGPEPTNMSPSDSAVEKQNETCTGCWANQFHTDPNGGKGKACQNTRRLAIMDPTGDGTTPLMLLKVSSTAIRSFDGYVSMVEQKFKVPVRMVMTEVSFAEDKDFPSLRFGNPRPLIGEWSELGEISDSRQQEALTRLLTEPEFQPADAAPPAPARRPPARSPTRSSAALAAPKKPRARA